MDRLFVRNIPLLFNGYGLVCLLVISSVFILFGLNVIFLCSDVCLLIVSQTLLVNGFRIFVKWVWCFCALLISLACVMKLACGFGLLCFYDIILSALILHLGILSMIE